MPRFVVEVLPLANHAQRGIIEVDDLDSAPELLTGGKLLHHHLEAALTGNTDHVFVGEVLLDAHGGGEAKAHGAKPARGNEAVGLVELVVLGSKYLVLTHIGGHVGLTTGHFAQRLDNLLGLERLTRYRGLIKFAAALLAPAVDLLPPLAKGLGVLDLLALQQTDHLVDDTDRRADDRHVCAYRLRYRTGIDIDMDDLGGGAEFGGIVGDSVVKARTDTDDQIGVVHGHVRLVGAVHAQPAQTLTVALRVSTNAHQRGRDGIAQALDQIGQPFTGTPRDHATTGIENRPLGLEHQLHGFLDLATMPTRYRVIGAHLDLFRVDVLVTLGRGGHILGNVHHHRAGTSRRGQIKGLFQHFRNFARVLDREAVLHDRPGHADDVGFLESVLANQMTGDLATQHHHGNRIHVGGGNSGNRIGGTGAGGDQHDTGFARGTGITVGGVSRGLFVAHQDVLDLVLTEQRIINMQRSTARITINIFDAFILQESGNHIRAG